MVATIKIVQTYIIIIKVQTTVLLFNAVVYIHLILLQRKLARLVKVDALDGNVIVHTTSCRAEL